MNDDDEELRTGATGEIVRAIAADPYVRKEDLRDMVELEGEAFNDALEALIHADVLVGLTRQSGSSLESRVPDMVYILNPDRADEFTSDDSAE